MGLGKSFETFTQAAALGALTKRIGMFVTAHVPVLTPAMARNAWRPSITSRNGRVGLNIVCGWNADEFDMHGSRSMASIATIRASNGGKFSEDARRRQDFRLGRPIYQAEESRDQSAADAEEARVMSAGSSSSGQDFAGQAADIMFTQCVPPSSGDTIKRPRLWQRSMIAIPIFTSSYMSAARRGRKRRTLLLLRRGTRRSAGARLFQAPEIRDAGAAHPRGR